ncbi:MAG: hypothetical protein FJY76_02560, partial [Candidatus Aenigmarchaeota archaeon]|nr:hypothetical protein [Candidatus Aenigmarchaeota archaeon]
MKKTGGALALALLSCVIMLLSVSASASAAALQDMNHDGKVGVTDLAMLMNRNLLKGDTNNDARVDIFDLAAVGLAYGSEPGDPNWNPNADVANTVDRIDVFDLATVGKNFGVQDESPPVLDPPVNVTPGYAGVILGDGFSINITIDSPVTVYAFDVVLLFNSTIMNAVSITEGNFLKKDGASTFSTNSTNNTKGRVNLAVTRIGTQNGISGTGNLATITFNATKAGTGSIGLAGVTLVNELLQTVAGVTTNNGTVVVSSPANQSPQSQWASAASSAEYYNDNWKAAFATGANDGSCNSWKANSAWCKKTASGNGSIELTFSSSVYASGLEIYFNGASQADFDAARVELVKDDGSSDTVWQGTNRNCVLGVTFAAKSYLARKVRVTTKPGYWGCVDAVRLTGYEGNQTACNESWVCSNWGTCIGNQQTRTCIDMNNCSTQNSKPATNQSCNVTCTKNSECGTDGWVGNASCSGNDVFQNWRTYTCNNPGTANASCSNTDTPTLKQDCGSSYCEGWQANYCKGNDVYRKRNCYNKGCSNGACFSDLTIEEEKVSSCQYGCNNGVCASQSPQSQWASAAAAANYYNDAWKAAFAVGVNDGSCNSWKSPSAWCKKALSSNSAIELGFADSVYATALEIHFTGVSAGDFNIDRVELQKPDGSWEVVWQGTN